MAREEIVAISGPLRGQRFEVHGSLSIGRNPDNAIRLDDLEVSRRHAAIEQTPSGTVLRDLGSGNGTFVGDRRVMEYRLSPGNVVRIGGTELKFEREGAVEEAAAARKGGGVRFEPDVEGTVCATSAGDVYETFFKGPREAATAEQLQAAQKRLAAVYKANQTISSERDLGKLFSRVMDQVFSLVPAHNGVILLKDGGSGELASEYVKSGREGEEVEISSTIVNRAFEHGDAVLTSDAAVDPNLQGGASIIAQGISSAMCTPLVHQDETLGVIYVDTRGTTNAFVEGDLELLVAVSAPAAIAIKNAQYVQMLEQSYKDTLIALANAVEMRDHYTVGHTWRVTNFALVMARELGWAEEQLENCERGGMLHDVGKIAVPDAVLCKPGRLTDEEFSQMKVHPERGARMMQDVGLLIPVIPYCLYHHERYDGKGYPYGLAGEDIPIEGRLVAVADTFDAMTSNRPYRKGLAPEFAISEIEKGSGGQFDPACAAALAKAYREGKIDRILQDYAKEEKSVACPFCSTYVYIPEDARLGDEFECTVCHRRIRLVMENEAYFGELVPETHKAAHGNKAESPSA